MTSQARKIVIGPDTNVWFIETATNNGGRKPSANIIARISAAGALDEFQTPQTAPDGVSNLVGLAAGPDGNLWFTEEGTQPLIGMITTQGAITVEYRVASPGLYMGAITTGPDGNLWFINGYVGYITPSGMGAYVSSSLPNSANDQGTMTTGPDGNIWYANPGSNTIGRVTIH